ncbi:hypothetical protein C3Y87_02225 [Carbonactinospora thermoautotrophica]|nr:hypothetical protein [Carbonactinospora thermoautotrophica]
MMPVYPHPIPETRPPQVPVARSGEGPRAAGTGLSWLAGGPTLLVTAWLLVALPLLLAGQYRPWLAGALFVPVAAVLLYGAARLFAPSGHRWPALLTVLVAVAFTAVAVATHAEHVIIRRDPGSYAQFAYWLARHGSLPIPGDLEAFGGPDPALTLESPAYFQRGDRIVPQFMAGFPLLAALGHWLGGWTGLLVTPAVLGGLALLAMGGLTGRLVGPRWAPLGALALGLAFPVLNAARATYSEAPALLLTLGGLWLLTEAVRPEASRWLAGLAGLVLGLVLLVRVDFAREIMLLLPVIGWLATRRACGQAELAGRALPFALGLAVGAAYGVVDGVVLSWPYLQLIKGSLVPLLYLFGAALVVVTLGVVAVNRGVRLPARLTRRVPDVAAAGVVLLGVFFVIRPYVQTVHGVKDVETQKYVRGLQTALKLPLDGSRSYDELSLYWVAWWVGWPLLVLTLLGAALLTRRVLRGTEPGWVAPLVVFLGSIVLTLWRPGITPDHPWADRRLVGLVLPGVVLFAVWAAAWLAGRFLTRRPRWLVATAGLAGVGVFVVPAAVATAPLVPHRTEAGEVRAVERVCAAFRPGDVAIVVGQRGWQEWPQVIRGVCGVPAGVVKQNTPSEVRRIAAKARAAGRNPVVVTGNEDPGVLLWVAGTARQVVRLETREHTHQLVRRPRSTDRIQVVFWMAPAPR